MSNPNEDTVKKVRKVFQEMVKVVNESGQGGGGHTAISAATLTQTYFAIERQKEEDFTPP